MTPDYFNQMWHSLSFEAADDAVDDFSLDEETLPEEEFEITEEPVEDPIDPDLDDSALDDTDALAAGADTLDEDEQEKKDKKEVKKESKLRESKAVVVMQRGKSKTAQPGYVEQPTLAIFLPERDSVENYFTASAEGMQVCYVPWGDQVGMESMQVHQANHAKEQARERALEAADEAELTRHYDYVLYGVGADDSLYETLEGGDEHILLLDEEQAYEEEVMQMLKERYAGRIYRDMQSAVTAVQGTALSAQTA